MLKFGTAFVMIVLSFFYILDPANLSAAALDCSELRPMRATESLNETNIRAGADVIMKKLASGEFKMDEKFRYKELFPQFLSTTDLIEIERFYYMACLALADEEFDPELRFHLFMQAQRERTQNIRAAFDANIRSDSPTDQIAAIEQGVAVGGEMERLAVTIGINSDDPDVRGAALMSIIQNSKVVSATVSPSGTSHAGAFGLRIGNVEKNGAILNFDGNFYGGIFFDEEHNEKATGTVRGDTLSFGNKICSMSARLEKGQPYLLGIMSCRIKYWLGRSGYYDGVVSIPLM